MGQPFVGEIRMFGGNFAPAGWMFCAGQLLPISENETLFNLIGTTYGGDGQTTFALPDLRGRLPVHFGGGYTLSETGGVETVTLTTAQMPVHRHTAVGSATAGAVTTPGTQTWAKSTATLPYAASTATVVPMNAAAISTTGGNQPHSNLPPYLCVTFIISLFGIFPSPN